MCHIFKNNTTNESWGNRARLWCWLLVPQLCLTLWTVARQAPLFTESLQANTGVGCHALLQGIFPTQELNPGLPHCRQFLYHLSHREAPRRCVCLYLVCVRMTVCVCVCLCVCVLIWLLEMKVRLLSSDSQLWPGIDWGSEKGRGRSSRGSLWPLDSQNSRHFQHQSSS